MEYAGMSAVEALRVARAAGVAVMIDGEGLLLRADAEPPRAVLDALSVRSPRLSAYSRRVDDGWTVEDWQSFFDEIFRVPSESPHFPAGSHAFHVFAQFGSDTIQTPARSKRRGALSLVGWPQHSRHPASKRHRCGARIACR